MIQEQVLNKILQDRDSSIITLNNLTADYFSDYVDEYSFIYNHVQKYSVVPDMATFLNVFPDFSVINVQEPTSYLLEELTHDKNKRFLAENYSKVRQLIIDDKVDEALSILKEASDQSSQLISLNAVNIIEDTGRLLTYEDKLKNKDKYFIKTGFKELDNIIGGWDVNEDLVTVVARNGYGKTWVLLKCAAAAAKQGKKVGVYSGEMSEDTVGYRIDTLIGHIANGALIHGGASVEDQYKNFLNALRGTVAGDLYVLTPKMINGPAGVSALRAFIERYNLDILFVDQHSLLEDDRKAKNPVEKASNISKDLKLLQTIKRIPIVTVCQQNRTKLDDGKTFDTTQLAQSDRIAQDSSLVIFIERQDDIMKLHIVKSRNTGSGNVLTYRTDLNIGSFIYVNEGDGSENSGNDTDETAGYGVGYSADEVF